MFDAYEVVKKYPHIGTVMVQGQYAQELDYILNNC